MLSSPVPVGVGDNEVHELADLAAVVGSIGGQVFPQIGDSFISFILGHEAYYFHFVNLVPDGQVVVFLVWVQFLYPFCWPIEIGG